MSLPSAPLLTLPQLLAAKRQLNDRTRLSLFGSGYKAFYTLQELVHGELRDRVCVVGVATDDPDKPFCNASRRFWRYHHTETEKRLVRMTAERYSIPTYSERISTDPFVRTFREDWRPDLLLVTAFGQRIPPCIFSAPTIGAWNFHPAGERWPSYCGGSPYEQMLAEQRDRFFIVMHAIDAQFDHGPLLARSKPIFIPPGASVKDLHKLSAVATARLAAEQVAASLDSERR
jgi:methionyl-tRNA formyltransferase